MTDLWAPTMMWDDRAISDPGTRWFRIWGRLQPGVRAEQARPVLQTVFTNLPPRTGRDVRQTSGPYRAIHQHSRPLAIGGERSVRSTGGLRTRVVGARRDRRSGAAHRLRQRREPAGGARGRARAGDGAARVDWRRAGTADPAGADRERHFSRSRRARWGRCSPSSRRRAIVSMLSTSHSLVRLDLQIDWRLLAFLAVAGSVVTFLFGLAPAFRASAVSPGDALKSGSGRHTATGRLVPALVAAQTAFSFVVLFVAGLCLTSFAKLVRTDLGFDRSNLAIVERRRPTMRRIGVERRLDVGALVGPLRTDAGQSSRPACRAGASSKAPVATRACESRAGPIDAYSRGICRSRPAF